MTNEIAFEKIKQLITENAVFLFMKGTPERPMCGFSGHVVSILKQLAVPFNTFDILKDEVMRQAIKEFSDWPTLPQLYIKGEFIGGCDIVDQLNKNGELIALVQGLDK